MGCCDTQPGLIPFDEALQRLLKGSDTVVDTEVVALADAAGRVLAEMPKASVSVPPADNSSMDGYALHTSDLLSSETALVVSQRIPAGSAPKPLQSGTCARIFTGAEIPEGANAVVMQENVRLEEDKAVFGAAVRAGENIRRMGQDIQAGAEILTVGTRLQPADLGMLASVGLSEIKVFKRLKVAILSTGDELVEPGLPLESGQIYNSNRYILTGLLHALGMEVVDLGCVKDTRESTLEALKAAADSADAIISTGGVSVGEEDHVKGAVEELGSLDMWKIRIKPGKPVAYGKVIDTPFIGLPGNPTSTLITFCLLGRPCLMGLQGMNYEAPLQVPVKAGFERKRAIQRQEYLRVRLENGVVTPFSNQSSGVLTSASWANGLAVIPPETTIAKGDPVSFIPLSELLI
ncbi:gephyrin-like molybdotransferase Glp [Neptuniibacter sp.]|uniref:molybdopterin molybdotransferase MoeA n=1 Tax=Neptuniibacter sp. TaxID=1962643 RepID=UPI002623BC5A|nr:gephyrin-like molybdotransferase Glp [Neptuniibacter sp.]MCP4595620.1 molybdopterin molybdotransferase MoeA [Neptuniibacter sp.]